MQLGDAALNLLDIERLEASPLRRDPFDFVVVERFLRAERLAELAAAFPAITGHGSYPLTTVACDRPFVELAAELEGDLMRRAIEAKFGVDLTGRPTMITLRGHSDGHDGGIHTDSATKIITVLIYMNPSWDGTGGRLRLLRGPAALDDYVAEVPPLAGTMVAFRRSAVSFHGHEAHVGVRRSIQLNWVTDTRVVRRELGRHRASALLKSLNPFRRVA
jgi:SM-20-related protein